MNPHFFTAPFFFAFIWFRIQGERFTLQKGAPAGHIHPAPSARPFSKLSRLAAPL